MEYISKKVGAYGQFVLVFNSTQVVNNRFFSSFIFKAFISSQVFQVTFFKASFSFQVKFFKAIFSNSIFFHGDFFFQGSF